MQYDPTNIFARILRQEISCKRIGENDYYLAFHDLHPRAPIHVLIIPKGPYRDASDFHLRADPQEITEFYKGIAKVTQALELDKGYRLIANIGEFGGQEVPHYHMHLLGGKKLGPIAPLEEKA
jgi:diadenosine tetraphosphate (Ap4A) HIT family hydrolase